MYWGDVTMKIDLIKIDEIIYKLILILCVIILWLVAIFVGLYVFNIESILLIQAIIAILILIVGLILTLFTIFIFEDIL